VTIYSEMLRMLLQEEGELSDRPVGSLVGEVLARRAVLLEAPREAGGRVGVAERIGDALAYDAALVHLCDRLGIEHELTGESAGPGPRRRAEQMLAGHLPSVAAALEDDRGAGAEPESPQP
jgi:hypothetical protein